MYRIMIVEDDEVIARAVQQSLVSWGMDAFCVQDFSSVLAEFAVKNPQLVLMDIHLPFFNGFHWCQEIRKVSKVPVIFLSSASDNMNIIMAVNMGGDDFIIFYNHNSIHGCSSVVSSKADIRNPLRYLLDSVKNIDSGRVFSTHSRSRSRFRR